MGLSDRIEAFISELLKNDDSHAEFGRNELADIFGCVPSQINYVISTRFNPDKGYIVESRRGGGGYVRISRIPIRARGELIAGIGNECDYETAHILIKHLFDTGRLEKQSADILLKAVSDSALASAENKNVLRAEIIKTALSNI